MTRHHLSKTLKSMSVEETSRITRLVKDAIKDSRSKNEITATFQDAGIIDKHGDLKAPYKEISIPVEE
jgi:signal transduction histidine kinase